jgi:hypothetical protein
VARLRAGRGAAWAQRPKRMRRIVFFHALAENNPEIQARIAAFRKGLGVMAE